MGNLMSSCISKKKSNNIDDPLFDSRRLLLMENMEEKIDQTVIDISNRFSTMITTYNKEINNLMIEVNRLNKENEKTCKKINDLYVLMKDKQNMITKLENKIYSLESQDEFLSTVDDANEQDVTEFVRS